MDFGRPKSSSSRDVFTSLATLVGSWEGLYPDGHIDHVTYHLTANGHALCEDWTMANGGKALTVYYPDGPRLFAAHYCPIGNFPRLVLTSTDEAGFHFNLHDVANLRDDCQEHQHEFLIKIHHKDQFSRSECYRSLNMQRAALPDQGWYEAALYRRLFASD